MALATINLDFIVLQKAGDETEWLWNLMVDVPLCPRPIPSISIQCHNTTNIAQAISKIYNEKHKHIHLRHNVIRQLIVDGVIALEFVSS